VIDNIVDKRENQISVL